LPTEAEWEAAARGPSARDFTSGDELDPTAANIRGTHVLRTTPVGVFPNGSTPEGVHDLTGNLAEWTSSLFGAHDLAERGVSPEFAYPYSATDGREDLSAGPLVPRTVRGCSWMGDIGMARAAFRNLDPPAMRGYHLGLRLAEDLRS
jgi:formylglycine-generating enzyme required for sulfatase activity